jgi:hypothetical protein
MVKGGLGVVLCATGFVVFSLVQAKKDVALEIRAGGFGAHPAILGSCIKAGVQPTHERPGQASRRTK